MTKRGFSHYSSNFLFLYGKTLQSHSKKKFRKAGYFLFIPFLFFGCSTNDEGFVQKTKPSPGTFIGTWTLYPSSVKCTTIVSRADSIFQAVATNDSTGEVLELSGSHVIPTDGGAGAYYTFYEVQDSSNLFGGIDKPYGYIANFDFYFTKDADTLLYTALRNGSILCISCSRQK